MDEYCPPKFNKDFPKSIQGIMKILLIVVGAFCWGLVYIGDVMATSNEAPEINDQVLFCSALTLPSWLLTVFIYILFSFSKKDVKKIVIPFRIDAAINFIFAILYVACAGFCASYEWFIWWCESGNSLELVDTGECPDRVLRNKGQNLAVIVLGSILAAGYAAAGVVTVAKRRPSYTPGKPQPNSSVTSRSDL